jgi:hypothetical protein
MLNLYVSWLSFVELYQFRESNWHRIYLLETYCHSFYIRTSRQGPLQCTDGGDICFPGGPQANGNVSTALRALLAVARLEFVTSGFSYPASRYLQHSL